MLAALLSLSLWADPVVMVKPFDGQGEVSGLALAAASVIEDDLLSMPGVRVRSASAKAPAATHLVLGVVTAQLGSTHLDVRVVEVRTKKVLSSTRITAAHWDERGPLMLDIAKALKVTLPQDFAPRYAPPEALAAWGAALKKNDPKAIAAVAAEWPDFSPAQRRLAAAK